MIHLKRKAALMAAGGLAVGMLSLTAYFAAIGSDHGDTTENVQRLGADLTDVYLFPSPDNPNNVVLVMDVHGLIPAGGAGNVSFDPEVLYQFKVDNNGDFVDDLVIQAKFEGMASNQTVQIAGPVRPARSNSTVNAFMGGMASTPSQPKMNTVFTTSNGMRVFTGPRKDPFFFDLERFCQILPDRCVPFTPGLQPPSDPNQPQATSWRNPGVDFLRDLNVLSIVIELPRASLFPAGAPLGKIGVWTTTSVRS